MHSTCPRRRFPRKAERSTGGLGSSPGGDELFTPPIYHRDAPLKAVAAVVAHRGLSAVCVIGGRERCRWKFGYPGRGSLASYANRVGNRRPLKRE